MNPASPGQKLTYDDFVLFPDDGKRHELIDGEHYVTPSPNRRHQELLGTLYLLIASWLEEHPIGKAMLSPFDVLFSDVDVVEPDLLYFSNARAAAVITPKNVQGAPEIVVEIASKSTRRRDETLKRQLYERGGVSEYWIIDPEIDVVRVFSRKGARFGRAVELSREAGDVLTTALIPALEMPLARIFRE
jgi:Uma2 family endonuclease